MSTYAEYEPTGRVRRKTALSAQYEDYDLTGFALPTLYPEPVSPHTQIPSNLSEGEDQEEGTTAFSLPPVPGDDPKVQKSGPTQTQAGLRMLYLSNETGISAMKMRICVILYR